MESSLLSSVILPISLIVIMLGMGLSLTLEDFKRVFVFPKAVTLGSISQIVALPLIGFACALAFRLPSEYALGLIILAASAGGATSNLFTYLAKGDTALSVTLTAISTCVTIITLPIIVNLSLEYFMGEQQPFRLPLIKTITTLFVITILPVAAGMFVRYKKKDFANKVEPVVRKVAVVFFIAVVLATVFQERDMLVASIAMVGPVTYFMNVLTMVFGFTIAVLFGLSHAQRNTISIEVGVQNGTTAIFVASTLLGNGTMAIPPAIYSLLMFFNVGIFIFFASKEKDTGA
jgi:BASS family bile acid:Na+ symporter